MANLEGNGAQIHVVGIGLEGQAGLSPAHFALIAQAQLLVGSDRHLAHFPHHPGAQIRLGSLTTALNQLQAFRRQQPQATIVILTSGDPLFFGLGRLLLAQFPAETLQFHPHVSSIQLAFSRLKQPWQDAQVVSVHGRSFNALIPLLQRGTTKLAILTDPDHSPGAIAQLILDLDLPHGYHCWVCENLGGEAEQIHQGQPAQICGQIFASLSVMVLLRETVDAVLNLDKLPLMGIPDHYFASFRDRPGLMTKREIRILVLGELALGPHSVVWDIGAGTGSVAIEMARLCPTAQIYAIEKTGAGQSLIKQNCQRFGVTNVVAIPGEAPQALQGLPRPDRIFIGGSGGNLTEILDYGLAALRVQLQETISDPVPKPMVLALATLEHVATVQHWLDRSPDPKSSLPAQFRQVQISRSATVGRLTRYVPLNPVTLVTIEVTGEGVRI